jgi:putative xylitol transport system permease protein
MVKPMPATRSRFNSRFILQYGIVLAFFVLCLALTFASPYFLTWNNWLNILRQTSVNGVLAIGMTCVILTGGIDLSVGSVLAFASMVAGGLVTGPDPANPFVAIAAGIAAGAVLGAINGVIISRLYVPPFVATLGMLSIARGLTFIYNDGMPFPALSDAFRTIGMGFVGPIPVPVVVFALIAGIFWFVLKFTTFGRYIYAVGGNEKAAKTSGINTRGIIFAVYAIAGALAGLAGMILTARTSSALPQAGVSYELDAIAAVVIGGTSLQGGIGSISGTVFGALIIGVINNGLDLLGVSSYYQQVVKGVIIVAAVLLDSLRRRRA